MRFRGFGLLAWLGLGLLGCGSGVVDRPDAQEPDGQAEEDDGGPLEDDGGPLEDDGGAPEDDAGSTGDDESSGDDGSPVGQGTLADPILIPIEPERTYYTDSRDTTQAVSAVLDSYPPHTLDESGPEFIYRFELVRPTRVRAWLAPEPAGVDIDLHLCRSLEPVELIARGDLAVDGSLEPGTYFLVADTYVSAGTPRPGPYALFFLAAVEHAGTPEDPIPIFEGEDDPVPVPYVFVDSRDTSTATSDRFDSYPPNTLDESGPEFVYAFRVDEPVRVSVEIAAPEPSGVDVDVHLLSSLDPLVLVARGHHDLVAELAPGKYWAVLDSFAGLAGPYTLDLTLRPLEAPPAQKFNDWVLRAVDWLDENHGRRGYDSAVLTHDVPYGDDGWITATKPPRTMCVAAVMEVILVAMQLYAAETGDASAYAFLPERSFESLAAGALKAHLWVNHEINAGGTGDALRHFGMGMTVPFESLEPGAFINLNRTSGTGHAVVFLAFIDLQGNESPTWHERVVGFKYFSSQGGYDTGGLDYRYAVFSEYGSPPMPYLRDLNVIYSRDQKYLNTGVLYHPDVWLPTHYAMGARRSAAPDSVFDPVYFDPHTADDPPR
jgi:hypothetical protein